MKKNIIAFRNGFLCLETGLETGNNDNRQVAMSIASELMQFGFLLDQSAIDQLAKTSISNASNFYNEIIPFLKDLTGSKHSYRPFWSGFPQQVMEMSEYELWLNQIVHYISGGSYVPNEWTKARPTAFEQPSYTIITSGDEVKMQNVFVSLVSVNNSLTPEDSSYVEWFINNNYTLPANTKVPFKETACMLMAKGQLPVKTVTDVLRIAVYMSGGDVSLPAVPDAMVKTNAWSNRKSVNVARELFKFKKFTRSERRYILSLLDNTNCDIREMKLKAHRWIRLGEILHPGEYSSKYPNAYKAFMAIRNEKITSWYGEIPVAFENSYEAGLLKIAERPGEFFRRIDYLVRNATSGQVEIILNVIKKIAPLVSNKVLFEVYSHFLKRDTIKTGRKVFIKGKRKATDLPDLPALDKNIITSICNTIIESLQSKFSTLESLGKVYIDNELSKIPVPTNMRSMNLALKPTIRGTRTPIGNQDAKVIRTFVHWYDLDGSVDIDLSATFIGMDKAAAQIGWNTNYFLPNLGCYSGDIVCRRGANAEYIDIDVKQALKEGYQYVIIDARNFRGGGLSAIQDCVFGYMEREFPESNMCFVPATLANTVRLQSDATNTIVAAIDLQTQEYIFLDIDQDGIPVASRNIDAIMDALKPYMELPKFSVYDLINLHSTRFDIIVDDETKADITFKFDDFANTYTKTLEYMGV